MINNFFAQEYLILGYAFFLVNILRFRALGIAQMAHIQTSLQRLSTETEVDASC